MHLNFTCESLSVLKKNLKSYHISLIALPFEAIEGFRFLETYFDIKKIFSHEETGNWISYQRDLKVIEYCKSQSIRFKEFPTNGVVRRLKSRDIWSRIWHTRIQEDIFTPQSSQIILMHPELEKLSQDTFRSYA